jgi:hypothetical protein
MTDHKRTSWQMRKLIIPCTDRVARDLTQLSNACLFSYQWYEILKIPLTIGEFLKRCVHWRGLTVSWGGARWGEGVYYNCMEAQILHKIITLMRWSHVQGYMVFFFTERCQVTHSSWAIVRHVPREIYATLSWDLVRRIFDKGSTSKRRMAYAHIPLDVWRAWLSGVSTLSSSLYFVKIKVWLVPQSSFLVKSMIACTVIFNILQKRYYSE